MMSEKRFFTKINKQGKNVIIDKECNTEIFDLTLACEVLNRLDLKRRWLNSENEQLRQQVKEYEDYKQRLQKSINTLKEMYGDE